MDAFLYQGSRMLLRPGYIGLLGSPQEISEKLLQETEV